ncbi:IS3 family transposase [Bacteroides finegoldii]|nr:IS3 family transposase [Bacteroides finegoldii]
MAKKSEGLSRGTRSPNTVQWAKAIDELRSEYPLDLLLELRKMARSVFYYHRKRLKTKEKYAKERKEIKSIFYEHKGRYGYRRITAEMRNRNYTINHKTVQRIMIEMGLKCQIRKVRYRSYKGEVGKTAPNIIERDFAATAPNRKWATDVTQINIGSAKLYLSPILDMYNGEIISYNISASPNLEQIYDMLDKAFAKFECLDGLILHSDQGWQYQHYEYRKRLKDKHIIQSMSRKGNCLDNSMMENFFGIMKSELLYVEKFDSPQAFIKALEEYIEYYNNKRIKSRLKGKSPVQYRTLSITS